VSAYAVNRLLILRVHMAYSHESIAKRMGFKGQSFKNRYHDNVIAMNRLLLDFVKSIKSKDGQSAGGLNTGIQQVGTQQVGTQQVGTQQVGTQQVGSGPTQPLDILSTTNGFPMVPPDVQGELMKKQWENLLRSYLSAHYCKLMSVAQ
jgi:hypothetical protein